MAEQEAQATSESNNVEAKADDRAVCGIVMPIAAIGDEYPEEHWRRVKKIIQRAIDRAGMRWQLVWENPEVDVIQSAILQNIYENDVVICDVSGLNPNVMLETGLRLSTKRPTVIVTDRIAKPPFDISTIGYIEYQRDLEYNAIEDFIDRLVRKLNALREAAKNDTYKSFVEHFKFETVTPSTVTVSAEDHLREQIERLTRAVVRLDQRHASSSRPVEVRERNGKVASSKPLRIVRVEAIVDLERASNIEVELDGLKGFGVTSVSQMEINRFEFSIPVIYSSISLDDAKRTVTEIVNKHETDYILS